MRSARSVPSLAKMSIPSRSCFQRGSAATSSLPSARSIRSSEAAEHRTRTPILAVTASAFEDQERMSRAVGMDGLITKPIGIEQLRATLDVWLKDARVEQRA